MLENEVANLDKDDSENENENNEAEEELPTSSNIKEGKITVDFGKERKSRKKEKKKEGLMGLKFMENREKEKKRELREKTNMVIEEIKSVRVEGLSEDEEKEADKNGKREKGVKSRHKGKKHREMNKDYVLKDVVKQM